jgi:hypothetical protein
MAVLLVCLIVGVMSFSEVASAAPVIVRHEYRVGNSQADFPRVTGIIDPIQQELINKNLTQSILSLAVSQPSTSIHGDYEIVFNNGRLLGVRFSGYSITPGMAHPNKIDQGIHIDLETGSVYSLADLFLPGVDYASRIFEICSQNQQDMRLQIEGLWDGWTHEDFADSWSGVDRAAVLQLHSMRVYSIPRYATGSISGYQVPYSNLMPLIDQKGALWRNLRHNVIDKQAIQVGSIVAGLKVKSLTKGPDYLTDVTFAGPMELEGVSEWVDNTGDGPGFLFVVNESDRYLLPALGLGREPRVIVVRVGEDFRPELPKQKTKVRLVIDQISMGERQIETTAKVLKATLL